MWLNQIISLKGQNLLRFKAVKVLMHSNTTLTACLNTIQTQTVYNFIHVHKYYIYDKPKPKESTSASFKHKNGLFWIN